MFRSVFGVSLSVIFIAISILTAQGAAPENEVRVWRDASGRFEVRASLVRLSDDLVVLRRQSDSKEVAVSLQRLSEEDRRAVRAMSEGNPFLRPQELMPAAKSLVMVLAQDERPRLSTGIVFLRTGNKAYVFCNRLASGGAAEPKVQILFDGPQGKQAVPATVVPLSDRMQGWVVVAEADALPPPLVPQKWETVPEMTYRVIGHRIEQAANPPTYVAVSMTATVRNPEAAQTVSRPEMLHVNERPPSSLALVLRDDGAPIGFVPFFSSAAQGTGQVAGASGSGVRPVPLADLQKLLNPSIVALNMRPVEGDRAKVTFEFDVTVSDPMAKMESPALRIVVAKQGVFGRPNFTAVDGVWPPLPGAEPLPLTKKPLTPKPGAAAVGAPSPRGTVYTARYEFPNPGQSQHIHFSVQLEYRDVQQKMVTRLAPMHPSYLNHSGLREGVTKDRPNIPGFNGKPLDMPSLTRNPRGGWQLTSTETKVAEADIRRPESAPFPDAVRLEGPALELGRSYEAHFSGMLTARGKNGGSGDEVAFSANGKWLYVIDATKNQLLKVDAATMKLELGLSLRSGINGMAVSKQGLLLAATDANALWLLDPETLKLIAEIPVHGPWLAAASPQTSIAVVFARAGGSASPVFPNQGLVFYVVDLAARKLVHRLPLKSTPSAFRRPKDANEEPDWPIGEGIRKVHITGDAKYMIIARDDIQRYRLEGSDLVYEEVSEAMAVSGASMPPLGISPDGKFVGLRGRIYRIGNLKDFYLTIKTSFSPIGFDPINGQIYALAGGIHAFDARGAEVGVFRLYDDISYPKCLAIHPQGGRIVITSYEKIMFVDTRKDHPDYDVKQRR